MIQEDPEDENNQTQNSMYVTGLGGPTDGAEEGTQARILPQVLDI